MGGFIANYESAHIQPIRHVISSPSKKIAFNVGLKHNDGLLANYVARAESLSYDDALMRIRSFVDNCDELLKEQGKLKIDKVGRLYYDVEKNLRFEQDAEVNHNLDSFGMTVVHASPIQRTAASVKAKEIFKDRAPIKLVESEELKRKSRIGWKTAIILPAVGLFLWASVNTYMAFQDKLNLSTLNPFAIDTNIAPRVTISESHTSEPLELFRQVDERSDMLAYLASGKAPVVTSMTKEEALVQESIASSEVTESIASTSPISSKEAQLSTLGNIAKFHAVAGCFAIKSNAVNLVAQLKLQGYSEAAIIGLTSGGLHIVSYHGFDNFEAALDSLNKYRTAHNKAAWVVRI